jgi:hypothetical protein
MYDRDFFTGSNPLEPLSPLGLARWVGYDILRGEVNPVRNSSPAIAGLETERGTRRASAGAAG